MTDSKQRASEQRVLYQQSNGIGVLTLNRPDQLNAMDEAMSLELDEILGELATAPALRALIITGAGRAFSAGGDLSFILQNTELRPDENYARMRKFYDRFLRVRKIPVPVIAAINGAAVGAGLCFALACDLRVSSLNARLGLTFVRLNLHPGMGAEAFLLPLIGPARSAELLLTGKLIKGEEALRIGLVNHAVSREDVLTEAHRLAESIASGGPLAVRQTLQTLRTLGEEHLERILHREASAQAQDFATRDVIEGVNALRESRAPQFADR